jgi:hypothetical protein|tara:strand:- start:1522 stop:2238 length:717 start_codon:yes stop_codon:yes gene_type:complete
MPLPTIATPTYSLILPSTKEEVNYRPFLVKEEKLLVLALESEDQNQISTAIKTVIQSCIKSQIDIEVLPTFDIEFLFLNIRGKSVGEEVEVNIIAPDDGKTSIPITINLDDIKVKEFDGHDKFIKLDDNLMMEMKYPSLSQFISNNFDFNQKNTTEQTFDLVAGCIDKVYNEEETWDASDFSKEEMNEFLDQMNSQQFKKVEKFFETMPKLSHEITVKNPKTKKSNKVVLEGLSSFFA